MPYAAFIFNLDYYLLNGALQGMNVISLNSIQNSVFI